MKACSVHNGKGVLNLGVIHIIPISRFGIGSYYQYWFISTGFCRGAYKKNTCFPRKVMNAALLKSFSVYPFLPILFKTRCVSKNA